MSDRPDRPDVIARWETWWTTNPPRGRYVIDESTPAVPASDVEALRAALAEAIDEYEYASQYKGEYLAAKHKDAETIAQLRAVLAGVPDAE